jgi:hypothetical protein
VSTSWDTQRTARMTLVIVGADQYPSTFRARPGAMHVDFEQFKAFDHGSENDRFRFDADCDRRHDGHGQQGWRYLYPV